MVMETRLESEVRTVQFKLLKNLKFHIPQSYPSIDELERLECKLHSVDQHILLDQVVLEGVVEVKIVYQGIDNLLYTLSDEITFLHKVERPFRRIQDCFCAGAKIDSEHIFKKQSLKEKKPRQFEVIALIELCYNLGFYRKRYKKAGPAYLINYNSPISNNNWQRADSTGSTFFRCNKKL